jgi:class 3 adenylate cyclase
LSARTAQAAIRVREARAGADRQDHFGTTVNIAARVQALAEPRAILATHSVVADPQASALLETSGLTAIAQSRPLRGIADEVAVYEIL